MSSNPKSIIQAIITNDKLSEEEKSELIAEFINTLNEEYPELKYHATKSDVKEVELKLTKEIKEIEANLKLEIEDVRKEIKEIEANLKLEIEDVRNKLTLEIENVRKEIKEVELKLTKEIKETKFVMLKWQFIFWITQMSAIIAIFYKLLK